MFGGAPSPGIKRWPRFSLVDFFALGFGQHWCPYHHKRFGGFSSCTRLVALVKEIALSIWSGALHALRRSFTWH